jgi:plasmid stability protein
MATLLIRNVDPLLHARLKARAAAHGRSMEEEARVILRESTGSEEEPTMNWVDAIRALVEPLGGIELQLPERTPLRDPPQFDAPEKRARSRKPRANR